MRKINFCIGGRYVSRDLQGQEWLRNQIMEFYDKGIVTKGYLAKPKLSSNIGVKYFRTLTEATNYLNKYTGFNLKSDDWKMVGKLLKRRFDRTNGFTYGIYSKDYLETFHVIEKIA